LTGAHLMRGLVTRVRRTDYGEGHVAVDRDDLISATGDRLDAAEQWIEAQGGRFQAVPAERVSGARTAPSQQRTRAYWIVPTRAREP
jgi:hypothetical protein